MKNLIKAVLVASTLVASGAYAQSTCENIETMAKSTMSARQNGVPMPDMLRVLENPKLAGTDIAKAARLIIVAAFEHPRYNSTEIKARVIRDFADEYMLKCLKVVKN